MWFDAHAALAELQNDKTLEFEPTYAATIATFATTSPAAAPNVAKVADVSKIPHQKPNNPRGASDLGSYLGFLRDNGPSTYGAAAVALNWGATHAWQVEARLRAMGQVRCDDLGKTYLVERGEEPCK